MGILDELEPPYGEQKRMAEIFVAGASCRRAWSVQAAGTTTVRKETYCDRLSLATSSAIARKERRNSSPSSALKNLSGLDAHCFSVW